VTWRTTGVARYESGVESEARIYAEIGRRVRAARTRAGLSQQDASIKAGMSYRWWQRLEAGESGPTVRTLIRIADALGIGFWDLVCTAPRRDAK
jgi:transcriptional regulator with XRE-family HTH domain